jgi:hypothetical protein
VPKIPRDQQAGCAYHVINRGNGLAEVFHKNHGDEAFFSLLIAVKAGRSFWFLPDAESLPQALDLRDL